MGTRGAYGFRIDHADKLAYNQFDSYPDGLGQDILVWLSKQGNINDLKTAVRAIRLVDGNTPPTEDDIAKYQKYADLSVSERSLDDWYCLLRRMQGDMQAHIDAGIMIDNSAFLADSLFCEWAYIVDLDSFELCVYKGFNTSADCNDSYRDRYCNLCVSC